MTRWLPLAGAICGACGDNAVWIDAGHVQDADLSCAPVEGEPHPFFEVVARDLSQPVAVASPPGDSRLFVIEKRPSRVRIVEDGELRARPFLDITGETANDLEQGLLEIAFHPRYAQNGRFYITWSRSDDAYIVEEWRVDPEDPYRADPSTRRTLFEIEHSRENHYGGQLQFGADGYLYVSSGDGGPRLDPEGHGHRLDTLRGKILRIDVDDRDPGLPYAIPDDNPFVGDPDARGEIWAYGIRQPWSMWIDPATQDLFFGDVGDDSVEEIDRIPAGAAGLDFGWASYEGGNECVEDDHECDPNGRVRPIYQYPHAQGCVVIVSPVYRGCQMPALHGTTFIGDYCGGWVRSFVWSAAGLGPVTEHADLEAPSIGGWGVDAAGEIYVTDVEGGTVKRLAAR